MIASGYLKAINAAIALLPAEKVSGAAAEAAPTPTCA